MNLDPLQQPLLSQLVVITTGVLLFVLTAFLTYFIRPRMGYRCYRFASDPYTRRFVIRSFEPADVMGPLLFELRAHGRLKEVRLFAGPWANKDPRFAPDGSACFELLSFPADGLIVVEATTESPAVNLNLTVSKQSRVQPRNFRELRNQSRWRLYRDSTMRWLLGLVVALLVCGWTLILSGNGRIWESDGVILLVLVSGSLVLYRFVASVRDKETIVGYLGWNDTERRSVAPTGCPAQHEAPRPSFWRRLRRPRGWHREEGPARPAAAQAVS